MLSGIAPRAAFPQDVVGVIMEFFTPNLTELHDGPASVSKRWHSAFLDHQPLWRYFCRQRWPKTLRKDLTVEVYKKRRTVEIDCAPIQPSTFSYTEIENCGFEFAFKCPMVAEMLRDTGEGASPDKPILHCDACDKHVYTCTTTDELKENVAQDRCVRFSRRLLERNENAEPHVQCLIPYKNEEQQQQVRNFLRTVSANVFVETTSPTLDPLHILHEDTMGRSCSVMLRGIPIAELKNENTPLTESTVIVLAGFFTDDELMPAHGKIAQNFLRQSETTSLDDLYSEILDATVPLAVPSALHEREEDIEMGAMIRFEMRGGVEEVVDHMSRVSQTLQPLRRDEDARSD